MGDPVLHLLAGPNGAGKSTLFARAVGPVTRLPFVNADVLAEARWGVDAESHAYEASREATDLRAALIERRASFATETVFSHESKLELIQDAQRHGYLVYLHVVVIPEELAVLRVRMRVRLGGHSVPEQKTRERYRRMWPLIAEAIEMADETRVYSNVERLVPVAFYRQGRLIDQPDWPEWTPEALRTAGKI
jgi:predicted ABC-type ATPase